MQRVTSEAYNEAFPRQFPDAATLGASGPLRRRHDRAPGGRVLWRRFPPSSARMGLVTGQSRTAPVRRVGEIESARVLRAWRERGGGRLLPAPR
jgi:hypothetical protein